MKSHGPLFIASMGFFILIGGFPSAAQEADGHDHATDLSSPYAGQETREIRTLSEEDIRQLQKGEGWGLAKAAELNGLPAMSGYLSPLVGQTQGPRGVPPWAKKSRAERIFVDAVLL